MSITAKPFNHAGLEASLMMEWNDLPHFADIRLLSINHRKLLIYKYFNIEVYRQRLVVSNSKCRSI